MKSLFNLLIVLLFTSSPSTCIDWHAFFDPNQTHIEIDGITSVHLILSNLVDETIETVNRNFVISTQNERVAVVDNPDGIRFVHVADEIGAWETDFHVKGVFLGKFFDYTKR